MEADIVSVRRAPRCLFKDAAKSILRSRSKIVNLPLEILRNLFRSRHMKVLVALLWIAALLSPFVFLILGKEKLVDILFVVSLWPWSRSHTE